MNTNNNKPTKVATKTAQQGDVLFIRLEALPDGPKTVVAKKKLIIAEGETTGHYHGIEETDSELIRIGERMLLNLAKTATLTHQEHGPITLEAGIWEVGGVREYDYYSKMVRRVED